MPLAKTSAGGNYGAFQLFPDRPIYLDFDAENGGSGTEASPLNSFNALFADDGLECLCQSLCCNKITVKIKGMFKNSGELDELSVEGNGRDYSGNLVIEPWQTACILNGLTVITGSENTMIDSEIGFFENVSGVVFRNLTFNWLVSAEKPADSTEKSGLGLIGELNGFKNCSNLRFINCSISQIVRINFAAGDYRWPNPDPAVPSPDQDDDLTPGWLNGYYGMDDPRGGWGGGGYVGGGGGGGSLPAGNTTWPDYTPGDDSCKVFFTASNFRECSGIRMDNCRLVADVDLRSNSGSRGWAFNLLASPLAEIANTIAIATAQTYDARAGGVSGDVVSAYSLVADSIASCMANCSNSGILNCQFATTAGATSTPINKPTSGEIGGQSKAESFAVLNAVNFDANGSVLTSGATATHPVRWSYMADPNFETAIEGAGNTFSAAYTMSSEGENALP